MRALSIAALFAIAAALDPAAAIAARSVAVPGVSGPAKSGAEKIEKQVRAQLAAEGLELVGDRALEKAAKKLHDDPMSPRVAREAGAELLVVITIQKSKKTFVVTGELIDTSSQKVLRSAKKSYKKATSAAAIGDVIGRELAEAAASAAAPASSPRGVEEDEPHKTKIVKPKDESPPIASSSSSRSSPAPREREQASIAPKDEARSSGASATVERPSTSGAGAGAGERKTLQMFAGGGSQVTSAYTVAVGGQVTGLAYNLSPLALLDAGARVTIPGTGLSLELELSFVPVTYSVVVDPPVSPQSPKGSFLNVAAAAAYRLDVAHFGSGSSFYLAPIAGITYSSLSVEAQAPLSVVLSSSRIAPEVGARFGLGLGDLTLEAQAKLLLVVSYNESPDTTGQDGGGIGLNVGGTARYWMSDNFGLSLTVVYEFARVSMTGAGTRRPFVGDPMLENATVFSGDLKTAVGVVLAL